VFTSPENFSMAENQTAVGTVSADDPEHDSFAFALAGGSDQAFFGLDTHSGALRFLAAPDFESPEDADHDNVYDVLVSATDTFGASRSQLIHVTVTDVAEPGQTIQGGNGNDTLPGTTGNDTIDGGNGNDTINGGDGNDNISGGNGNDVLVGGRGDDILAGGNGDDVLDGGIGNNQLAGGNGNDVFHAWTGNNTIAGGTGNDTFAFGPQFGDNIVTDFGSGDHIEFDGVFGTFQAVHDAMHQAGADTVISLSGHTITLQHVSMSSLHGSDFLFG
jgi:Ca2+-binding RTX toxin-like protein